MRKARLQSLGLAYLSPQNKSLAQSFRYMRNKPTIIAFKTPSLDNYQAQLTALAAKSMCTYSINVCMPELFCLKVREACTHTTSNGLFHWYAWLLAEPDSA